MPSPLQQGHPILRLQNSLHVHHLPYNHPKAGTLAFFSLGQGLTHAPSLRTAGLSISQKQSSAYSSFCIYSLSCSIPQCPAFSGMVFSLPLATIPNTWASPSHLSALQIPPVLWGKRQYSLLQGHSAPHPISKSYSPSCHKHPWQPAQSAHCLRLFGARVFS